MAPLPAPPTALAAPLRLTDAEVIAVPIAASQESFVYEGQLLHRDTAGHRVQVGALPAVRVGVAQRQLGDRLVVRVQHFFFQAEDGIRDGRVTGVQTCALPI